MCPRFLPSFSETMSDEGEENDDDCAAIIFQFWKQTFNNLLSYISLGRLNVGSRWSKDRNNSFVSIVSFAVRLVVRFVVRLIVRLVVRLVVGFVVRLAAGFIVRLIVRLVVGFTVRLVVRLAAGFIIRLIVRLVVGFIVGFIFDFEFQFIWLHRSALFWYHRWICRFIRFWSDEAVRF